MGQCSVGDAVCKTPVKPPRVEAAGRAGLERRRESKPCAQAAEGRSAASGRSPAACGYSRRTLGLLLPRLPFLRQLESKLRVNGEFEESGRAGTPEGMRETGRVSAGPSSKAASPSQQGGLAGPGLTPRAGEKYEFGSPPPPGTGPLSPVLLICLHGPREHACVHVCDHVDQATDSSRRSIRSPSWSHSHPRMS